MIIAKGLELQKAENLLEEAVSEWGKMLMGRKVAKLKEELISLQK